MPPLQGQLTVIGPALSCAVKHLEMSAAPGLLGSSALLRVRSFSFYSPVGNIGDIWCFEE